MPSSSSQSLSWVGVLGPGFERRIFYTGPCLRPCVAVRPPPFNFCGGPWRMYTAACVIVYEYCTVLVLSKLAPVYVVSVL